MCAAVPRPAAKRRASSRDTLTPKTDQRDQTQDDDQNKHTTLPTPVSQVLPLADSPRCTPDSMPSIHPYPTTHGPGATSKETCRETARPRNQQRAGGVSDAHPAMGGSMAFDQDECPSWATRARCLFGPETGASPEGRGRQRVPCFADIGMATGTMEAGGETVQILSSCC